MGAGKGISLDQGWVEMTGLRSSKVKFVISTLQREEAKKVCNPEKEKNTKKDVFVMGYSPYVIWRS